MKCCMNTNIYSLSWWIALLAGFCTIWLLSCSIAAAGMYVTPSGSAAPESGLQAKPFMLVESAVYSSNNTNIIIEGGVYRGKFTPFTVIDKKTADHTFMVGTPGNRIYERLIPSTTNIYIA